MKSVQGRSACAAESLSAAFAPLAVAAFILCFSVSARGQRAALLLPEPSDRANAVADRFAAGFEGKIRLMDRGMVDAAFSAVRPETPLNMTDAQARVAASAIGCDILVLLKSETLRRTSPELSGYYESYVAAYVADGRSGQMLIWDLASFRGQTAGEAEKRLDASAAAFAQSIAARLPGRLAAVAPRPPMTELDTIPDGVKPPVPYRRIKPEYTSSAYLYGVRATVEVEADIDESGNVRRTAVIRWAGFGLDEAAVTAVRSMNWRPAMRGATPLAMRVLLRYNFTRIEKE